LTYSLLLLLLLGAFLFIYGVICFCLRSALLFFVLFWFCGFIGRGPREKGPSAALHRWRHLFTHKSNKQQARVHGLGEIGIGLALSSPDYTYIAIAHVMK